ncbi:MAG: hypothetical protein EBS49_05110 [Verrucomicrobia bacterium]|nr:hypothetical protein [Verrucomicrobiota bacterium]
MVAEVRRTWVTPLRKPSPPWWQGLAQLAALRGEKYDAALSWTGSDRNLYGVGWSGARDRIARITGKNSWPARWRLTRAIEDKDRSLPVFQQRLAFLRELGWSGTDPGWGFQIPDPAGGDLGGPAKKPYLHLSVNAASTPLNEWPLDDWAETLRQIWKQAPQLEILATGAGSEREAARLADLAALTGDARLKIFAERCPVARLAFLLKNSGLHLGLDSGVLHLAAAGNQHHVLRRDCPCIQTGRNSCEGTRALCLSKILPGEVVRAVLAALPATAKG